MRVLIAIAAVALLVSAQPEDPQPAPAQPEGGVMVMTDMISQHVQGEQQMARHLLELILKMQHAQYTQQAGSMYVQVYMLAQAAEQQGDNPRSLEENYYYDSPEDADQFEMVDKLDMFADYYLFFANKIKLYQVIGQVNDLQMEYMVVRAFQIQAQYMGNQLPGGMMQMLYMRVLVTYMKTVRLSYALQVINSFTTWLEDEIDVDVAVVGDDVGGFQMRESQRDDLIVDKEFAFHALHTFTQLDMTVFYIEWYLEYMMAYAAAPPAAANNAAAASLLEVEETETPAQPSQSQFMPYMYFYYPQVYKKFYKMYHLMFMMTAANSALQSVIAERHAWQLDNNPDVDGDPEDADKFEDFSFQMFSIGFGSSLHSAGQLEYLTVMLEWFTFLAPMFGGAF